VSLIIRIKKRIVYILTLVILLSFMTQIGLSDDPQPDPIITRGASWDEVCIDGICTRTYYSGNVNIYNGSEYIPFADFVDVSVSNGNLVMSRGDKYSVSLQPIFEMENGNRYNWADIPSEIGKDLWKKEYQGKYKYGVDFTNIPDNIKDNLKYIILHRTDSSGLTWDDVRIENNALIVKDKIEFSHDDVLADFTIPIINKNDIVIGNLTPNFVDNGDGTWNLTLDPEISEYNFTVEQNIFAADGEWCSDTITLTNKYTPISCDFTHNLTSDSDLDSSDDNRVYTRTGSASAAGTNYIIFWAVLSNIDLDTITNITWYYEGYRSGIFTDCYPDAFYWNVSSSRYEEFLNNPLGTSDTLISYDSLAEEVNISDIVDGDGLIHFALIDTDTGAEVGGTYTDFTKFVVTYISPEPDIGTPQKNTTETILINNTVRINVTVTSENGNDIIDSVWGQFQYPNSTTINKSFTLYQTAPSCSNSIDAACSDCSINESCTNCTDMDCSWIDTPESVTDFETFGSDLGDWTSTGDTGCSWAQDTDGTPSSNTGSCGGSSSCATNDAGYDDNEYTFVETSRNYCDGSNDNAWLTYDNKIDMDTYPDSKIYFAYYAYGTHISTLHFEIDDGIGGWDSLWNISGPQGAEWFTIEVDFTGYSGERDIRFNYIRDIATSYYGDIVIDVLNITTGGGIGCSGTLNCSAVTNETGCEVCSGCEWGTTNLYPNWLYDWTDTINNGTYNITKMWANDTGGNINSTLPIFGWIVNATVVVGDSCDTNAWDCTENCIVTSLDAGGNTITATGTGVITITGDVTNCNQAGERLHVSGACVIIKDGVIQFCEP